MRSTHDPAVPVHKSVTTGPPKNALPTWNPGVYRSNVGGQPDEQKLWHERLPIPITLELLGRGLANSPTRAWPRHAEFVAWMFERLGWNPNEFLGYRGAQTYPMWQCYYEIGFEFPRA